MVIIKSKKYLRDFNKLIVNKNLQKELERINNIENLIIALPTLQDVICSPFKNIYHIEQKKGDLKEFYTTRINNKVRLIMKPHGSYSYNKMEITEIEFINIDDSHYGEG